MAPAPYDEDRQKVENLVIQAGRTLTPSDFEAAKKAIAEFVAKWPDAAGSVDAYRYILDSLKR